MISLLQDQLQAIGLQSNSIVMVHASMRAAKVDADALIGAILKTADTMMMYIGCESPYDDVGRGKYTPEEERHILETCPAFDFQNSPAQPDHGILAEKFRTCAGTLCSHHVGWRMAANGPHARELMNNHPLQFGAGPGSPMEKLVKAGGKILLIGSDFDHVTLLHYAEGLTDIPDKKLVHCKAPLLIDGQRQWIDITEHNSSTGIVDWPDLFFEEIIHDFITRYNLQPAKIGEANSYLIDAGSLVSHAVPYMERRAP